MPTIFLSGYFSALTEKFLNGLERILPTVIFAIVVLIAGKIVTEIVLKLMSRGNAKGKLDGTVHSFLKSLVTITLKIFTLVIVLTILGVPMTSIIAVIGAAGLAIGLALQESLSNIAGGFVILFARPFKVGDLIESNGSVGTISAISILYTQMITFQNETVFIPNSIVANNKLTNFTELGARRLDLTFSISYDSDFEKANALVSEIIAENPFALNSPAPIVRLGGHSESALEIHVKVWVKPENYLLLNYDLFESVKKKFDENGITIPFKQIDVRVIEKNEKK